MSEHVSRVNEHVPCDRLPPDVRRALDAIEAGTFDPDRPLFVARAPGRLDLMGGIADYSGGEVLQMPIREAAVVLLQRTEEPVLDITSTDGERTGRSERVRCPLAALLPPDAASLDAARVALAREPLDAWAAYVAGVFPVLAAHGVRFAGASPLAPVPGASAGTLADARASAFEGASAAGLEGARIVVRSDVPEGKGVSSSAALEVATMRAVAAAWGVPLDAHELALLCQRVENALVGAPCGLMDQMTSSAGRAGRLLSMRCQPDQVLPDVAIPPGLAVFGIDSGVRHAVGGADYGAVRTAAFMGYRLLLERAGIADGSVRARDVVDTRWRGYLANVDPSELRGELLDALPERLSGADFLARFDATTDAVTRVEPGHEYDVRAATLHPVHERVRVETFRRLLSEWREAGESAGAPGEDVGVSLGALMYGSHASYSACGLDSAATDRLVEAARTAGPGAGVLGARITGGGSGGTVAILARREARAVVERIAADHRVASGHDARLFDGSSDGARAWSLETSGSSRAASVPVPPPGD